MTDWIARTCIKLPDGIQYRVKVFDRAIGHQQPAHGDNVLYSDTEASAVRNGTVFDTRAVAALINRYEADGLLDYETSQYSVTSQGEPE